LLEDDWPQAQPRPALPTDCQLLRLEVELENGRTLYLTPTDRDQPAQLASLFCQQHNLDAQMVPLLTDSIRQSLQNSHGSCPKHSALGLELPTELTEPPAAVVADPERRNLPRDDRLSPSWGSKRTSTEVGDALYDKGRMLEAHRRSWIEEQRERRLREEQR
jgi:hypothetical protein